MEILNEEIASASDSKPRIRTISIVHESDNEENDQFDYEPVVIPKSRNRTNVNETNACGGVRRRSSISLQGLNEIRKNRIRLRWQLAVKKAKLLDDPWAEFHILKYPAEKVIRHRYNAIQQKWIKDECIIKMETEPFAFGAMRACYRVKKLSNSVHKTSWEHAANYVAKCFMTDDVLRERYFDDVKLQMDAKLWAERYNRHNPPKKIDMFQVSIIEFINRPNSPLYHFEHYIDGSYVKYNSNSGFVCDEVIRHTPQAFSHFTFESSNHELIVVDVQGVGDLYTDPQIHTYIGTDYGDGNLGTKGMALFFKSHVCNEICEYLGLTPFDLAESEEKKNEKYKTLMKKRTSFAIGHALEKLSLGAAKVLSPLIELRNRFSSQTSNGSEDMNNNHIIQELQEDSEGYESAASPSIQSPNASISRGAENQARPFFRRQSQRTESGCFDSPCSPGDESFFNTKVLRNRRSSCVAVEQSKIEKNDMPQKESILGQVHFELCKYHEMGRFTTDDEEIDLDAAFYHLEQAAELGIKDALINIAKIYLDLPHDLLEDYRVPESEDNASIGFNFILEAAKKGDKNSMIFIAKAYDTGNNLPNGEEKNWKEAIKLYNKLVESVDDDKILEDMGYSDNTEEPIYIPLARMAEIYQEGGYGVEKNLPLAKDLFNKAAEKAMLYGKGRISNKYYMLAEAIPDDEENDEEE